MSMQANYEKSIAEAVTKYLGEWSQSELRAYVQDSLEDYLNETADVLEVGQFLGEYGS
jgi:hypothetical protein